MGKLTVPELGDSTPRRGNAVSAALGRSFLRLAGWDFDGEIPDVAKAVLIVAPHTSNWDFFIGVAAMFALGIRVKFLGKHTLFAGLLGPVMRWLGGIPVDRRTSRGVVNATVELFADCEQMILGLAPEGTRSRVERWKTGFYHVAHDARVPIVPIAFDYPGRRIRIGDRFDTTGDVEGDLKTLESFYRDVRGLRSR